MSSRIWRLKAWLLALLLCGQITDAATKPAPVKPAPPHTASPFQQEQAMAPAALIRRWTPLVKKASHRFGVPVPWINAVMRVESGGRTMLSEGVRMVSPKGAMGIMQVMPQTFSEMRAQYRLGPDPYDPGDNIQAGTAYLRWLKGKYGYPALFAAYNAGPQRVDDVLAGGATLPPETQGYIARVGAILDTVIGGPDGTLINAAHFTQPDGAPVQIDPLAVTKIRAVLPDEYAPTVQTVIQMGRIGQGVREDAAQVTRTIRLHGGRV